MTARSTRASTPVRRVRNIPRPLEIVLFVRAGGRCEFDGCNQLLVENRLTLTVGNFAEKAHIVAFAEDGPRGRDGKRPRDINELPNLMLLCPTCHKEIDDHPTKWPREALERFKAEHERRIELVTGASPNRKTTIVLLKSRIGGKQVAIPPPDVFAAVAPYYPEDRNGFPIDLSEFDDRDPGFIDSARRRVDEVLRPLHEQRLEGQPARHVSVFAFGPIPVLAYLGSRLSDKLRVDFYQFHRDTKSWSWPDGPATVRFRTHLRRTGTDRRRVALLVSLSGTIRLEHLRAEIDERYFVYELTLEGAAPNPMILRAREDLVGFRAAYLEFFALLEREHPPIKRVDVFPAVPLPIAVMLGHELLNKAHPAVRLYDLRSPEDGFVPTLDLNPTSIGGSPSPLESHSQVSRET